MAQTWIGLVLLKPLEGNYTLEDAKGAYVNTLAWATGEQDFVDQVEAIFSSLGFEVEEIEALEPFDARRQKADVPDDLNQLADEVEKTKEARFGVFHAFEEE